MSKSRTCKSCGEGKIVPITKTGRTGLYNRIEVPIPADFPIRTCTHCGEQWINRTEAKALDKVLEETVKRAIEQMVKVLETRTTQVVLERALGLSTGYLSKIKRGERSPSASLFRSIALVTKKPDVLEDLVALDEKEFLITG